MVSVLFVCHGNICRSPMAESVFCYLLEKEGLSGRVRVASAAARTDEIGNPPHRGTREKLEREHIPLVPHRARLMTKRDGEEYDFLLGMDQWNAVDMRRIVGQENAHKVKRLLDFAEIPRDIADPWYTGDFDKSFEDILEGCHALLRYLKAQNLL